VCFLFVFFSCFYPSVCVYLSLYLISSLCVCARACVCVPSSSSSSSSSSSTQLKEKVVQRQQGSYILTVEAGRQLLLSADSRAEVALQAELTLIQDGWRHANASLDTHKRALATLLKVRAEFETNERCLRYRVSPEAVLSPPFGFQR